MTSARPRLEDVRWIDLPSNHDDRGTLTSIESGRDIPIHVARVFYVHRTTRDRGGHAHRDTDQLLVAVHGSLVVRVFDGGAHGSFPLDDATTGLYVPRLLFLELLDFSSGAVCLVLANTHYDPEALLRSRREYLAAVGGAD